MRPVSITPGDKLIISAKAGQFSKETYFSRIGDILDSHLLLVYTPISEGSYIWLPVGEEYSFLFYTKDGLFKANGKILGHFLQNNVDLTKIEVNEYNHIQRRNFYRLNFILDFTFIRKKDLAEGIIDDNTPINKGVIKDISGAGLCFISNLVLTLNEILICKLTLNSPELTIEGRVRGIELLDDSDYRYIYRIEFVNIESSLQEQIVQYVFYIQRERIKKI